MIATYRWLVRIDALGHQVDTMKMNEETYHHLMDQAEHLALKTFGDTAECEHIVAVFERLALHWQWGLPVDGATTVH